MKNRNIVHAHQESEIYKAHYRPSVNPLRFMKSILCVLIHGSSATATARSYVPVKKKLVK